ncbi:hypothetical protein DEA98_13690 [Brucella pseudogrignonensis]|nr:hypothetical protein [Brucella pseudogrignonensis]
MKVLEGVFNGLKTAWTDLKEIGSGIEPSLAPIGESLRNAFGSMGDTWNSLKELGSALGILGSNLMKLVGFKASDGSLQTIGKFIGELGQIGGKGIEIFAKTISIIVEGLAGLAGWAAGTKQMPNWLQIFPDAAGQAVNLLASGVEKLWGYCRQQSSCLS